MITLFAVNSHTYKMSKHLMKVYHIKQSTCNYPQNPTTSTSNPKKEGSPSNNTGHGKLGTPNPGVFRRG
jgi:hypothetical protein